MLRVLTLLYLALRLLCTSVTEENSAVGSDRVRAYVDSRRHGNVTRNQVPRRSKSKVRISRARVTSQKKDLQRWKKLYTGCPVTLAVPLCEIMLLQRSCEYSKLDHVSKPEEVCETIWPQKSGEDQPLYLYCLAAAHDPDVMAAAEKFFEDGMWSFLPEDCTAEKLKHVDPRKVVSWKKGNTTLQEDVDEELRVKILDICQDLVDNAHSRSGLCNKDEFINFEKDCAYFSGIRSNVQRAFGKGFCSSQREKTSRLRCSALRQRTMDIVDKKTAVRSTFNDAYNLQEVADENMAHCEKPDYGKSESQSHNSSKTHKDIPIMLTYQ